MWMRSVIFLSCCLFPLRCYDLYLKLLAAAPQTLLTVNGKHVREPKWIWRGRTCRLGWRKSPHSQQWWNHTVSAHTSHELPGGCSTLSRADGLPLRCKGQRLYWAQILWVSDCLKRGNFILRIQKLFWMKRTEFPNRRYMVFRGVVTAPGVCHPGLEEGLYFTDGRADVSVLLRVFDYRTWFQCLRKGVECGKSQMSSWFLKQGILFSLCCSSKWAVQWCVGYFNHWKELLLKVIIYWPL